WQRVMRCSNSFSRAILRGTESRTNATTLAPWDIKESRSQLPIKPVAPVRNTGRSCQKEWSGGMVRLGTYRSLTVAALFRSKVAALLRSRVAALFRSKVGTSRRAYSVLGETGLADCGASRFLFCDLHPR